MTLNDIELRHGTRFSSECRVRRPVRRTAANGSKYLSLTIEDCSRSLRAYAWPDQCDSSVCVHDLDKVNVSGKIRAFNGEWLANITSIRHTEVVAENSLQLIPYSLCPLSPLLERLRTIVEQISNDTLRNFVGWVFSDDNFTLPFINLPASRRHHHAMAGGLLEHSLECAEMVQHFSKFNPDIKDLAVVAALLHDIGKVITLRTPEKFCLEGAVLDHNALTLEVLAPHLKALDAINKEMATALRYLWTWRYHRRGIAHPALTIAEAVSAADRISSGLSIEEMTFKGRPEWQTVARAEQSKSMFWRPNLNWHIDNSLHKNN